MLNWSGPIKWTALVLTVACTIVVYLVLMNGAFSHCRGLTNHFSVVIKFIYWTLSSQSKTCSNLLSGKRWSALISGYYDDEKEYAWILFSNGVSVIIVGVCSLVRSNPCDPYPSPSTRSRVCCAYLLPRHNVATEAYGNRCVIQVTCQESWYQSPR